MENLILLHGALGAASTLEPLKQALSQTYNVFSLNFAGHGGDPIPAEGYSMPLFAQNVTDFMEQHQLEQAHIFGYSMGGYGGLYMAQQQPDKIKSVFTLATKFAWTEEAAAKEVKLLDPDKIKEKVPQFADALARRHSPQPWEEVMHQTADMMLQLGRQPLLTPDILGAIQQPVQVAVGDQDNMVTIEETVQAFRSIPKASLLVLPATKHPLESVPVNRLHHEISSFVAAIKTPLPA